MYKCFANVYCVYERISLDEPLGGMVKKRRGRAASRGELALFFPARFVRVYSSAARALNHLAALFAFLFLSFRSFFGGETRIPQLSSLFRQERGVERVDESCRTGRGVSGAKAAAQARGNVAPRLLARPSSAASSSVDEQHLYCCLSPGAGPPRFRLSHAPEHRAIPVDALAVA